LRTAPTRRLLAVLACATAVIAVGATIAVAAAGGGPVPAPRPLAQAIHNALAAPKVQGISAAIKFTNRLISSSEIQGGDPLLTGAAPADVAGRPAYTVTVSPKPAGGLLGSVQLAWDALKGVPLRFAVYARGDSSPVIELAATGITYGPVSSGVFSISPPAGAKVVSVATPSGKALTRQGHHEASGRH